MEFVVLLIVVMIVAFGLVFVFGVDLKRLKAFGEDRELDEIVSKYPGNVEICKWYLRRLNNESVCVEEDKNSGATLYLVLSNKIFIADLKNSYTRIQTIAHECLHSVQSKRLLWFNFIFSNFYLLYFLIVCGLAVFRVLPCKMLFVAILMFGGLVFYAVRAFLENDAMIKARFLAEDYMQEMGLSSSDEIGRVLRKFDELNDIGIRCTNFQLLSGVLIKVCIFLVICALL